MFTILSQQIELPQHFEYIFFNCFAMLLLLLFAFRSARLKALPWKTILLYLIGLVLAFILGARITEQLFYHEQKHLLDFLFKKPYGFSLYGGLLFLIIYQYAAAYLSARSPWDWLDHVSPGIWSYVILGKLGCFLNGCCFGTPTLMPWGVHYPVGSQAYTYFVTQFYLHASQRMWTFPPYRIHPVQLYESIAALFLLIVSLFLLRKKSLPGLVFLLTFGLYSLFRLGFFYLRVPPDGVALYYLLPSLYIFVIFFSFVMLFIKLSHIKKSTK